MPFHTHHIFLTQIIFQGVLEASVQIYRVIFLTGPAQKSSKYGTGPTQEKKLMGSAQHIENG